MDVESKRLIVRMKKGVYDALQKKYLGTLMFCVCPTVEGPVIEEYSYGSPRTNDHFRPVQGTVLDTTKSLIFPLPLLAVAHQQFLAGCRHADANGLDGLKVQIILSSICYQPCLFMLEFNNSISADVEGDGNESNSTVYSEYDVNGVVIEESQSQNNKRSEMRMLGC
ncbi:unnamed protein product [Lactuca virosa]|uniref:HORMA domain-containing protein n=1 Tax=Lactuca virosa TaxID=75947 RepID=A0AAU9N1U3_9ASTR|nr:unnamed protein product [Lactuca virosa]